MLHKARLFLEKYKYSAILVSFIRNSKFWHGIRKIQANRRFDKFSLKRARETREEFTECYNNHKDMFEKVESILDDEFSRKTLRTVIKYRLAPSKRKLRSVVVTPLYFQKDLLSPKKDEVFIDGGAYTGDTLIDFEEFCGGKRWKKVYAWEPDDFNRNRLIKTCETHKYKNVKILPIGLWSKKTKLHFTQEGKDWSKISENGSYTVEVNTIDNVCWKDKVTFIKMDIEGSEMEALKGAEKIILRDKPRLTVSIYHKPQDYFEIPLYLKKLVPEYKIYIRHHRFSKNDTVVYAILK